jgi:hypothetical protein
MTLRTRYTWYLWGAAAAATMATHVVRAQSASGYTESFALIKKGADTADVERFSRKGTNVSGDLANRGSGLRGVYTFTATDSGLVPRMSLSVKEIGDAPTAPPKQAATFTFGHDSATVEVAGGATQRIATPVGALPWISPSIVLTEQIIRRARVLDPKKKSVGFIPLVNLSGGAIYSAQVNWVGPDSAVVLVGGVDIHVALDATGHVTGGSVPQQDVTVVRSGAKAP